MKNKVFEHGNRLNFTAAADVASGEVVAFSGVAGVAISDVASGAEGVLDVEGVFDLPKASATTFAVGSKVYLSSAGLCVSTASGNNYIGVAWLDAVAAELVVQVKLN